MSNDTIADPKQFEASLQALEAIVDQLEHGDLTLEASLEAFERGVRLSRGCQQALEQAEQRVRILTEQTTEAEPEPFSVSGQPPGAPSSQPTPDPGSENDPSADASELRHD
ncbi:MAG: exodeoxyribonuclease VII small subunit [Gammaproteobacteria bacterium]|jgi:exodeoxyribonuclease VII small subunit|nr:exodeoxyribonuclease VII small subunit [Gammaproteobacteria bacterium]